MPDGLDAIRQRLKATEPYSTWPPSCGHETDAQTTFIVHAPRDVERLLAIAEAAREYWETESEFARDVLGRSLDQLSP